MALNKLALLRYKTIDKCLQNRLRKWTLEDLIDAVSDALYDYEDKDFGVGRRTIQQDIKVMRSDKLGYNAPIIVLEKKYYTYEDKDFSITKGPINTADYETLSEMVDVLKQFSGFSFFDNLTELVTKLENNLIAHNNKNSFIQFEENVLVKGLSFIHPIYMAIKNKNSLQITYQSFNAHQPSEKIYYPYLLKEFRNRWFLFTKAKGEKPLYNLALDRMQEVQIAKNEKYKKETEIDFATYFDDIIGVTKNTNEKAMKIILAINNKFAQYISTKPLHSSQIIVKQTETETYFQLTVVLNLELERDILSLGENVKVLAPRLLQSRIKRRVEKTVALYATEV